eukprot:6729819-Ditylum_brightwellii.AAC.1
MNDNNEDSNTIVLGTPLPSDDEMGDADMDNDSVFLLMMRWGMLTWIITACGMQKQLFLRRH